MTTEVREIPVRVRSGFGATTKQPFVLVVFGEHMEQMSPAEARTIAHMLLECAEAAETDGFLWKYFTKVLGANEQQAARILLQYRAEREQGRE